MCERSIPHRTFAEESTLMIPTRPRTLELRLQYTFKNYEHEHGCCSQNSVGVLSQWSLPLRSSISQRKRRRHNCTTSVACGFGFCQSCRRHFLGSAWTSICKCSRMGHLDEIIKASHFDVHIWPRPNMNMHLSRVSVETRHTVSIQVGHGQIQSPKYFKKTNHILEFTVTSKL